ncbi:MAG TPA: NAD(P)-binding domain-containing protein [Polyangiaceae bacterium]
MNIGVLGTGMVGTTLGTKLAALGHQVKMGSRATGNEKAVAWVKAAGPRASEGTFADAASFGEVVFNCTSGAGALPAVESAKAGLAGKILIDVSNPLDFSKGMPPVLLVSNDDSLGERIQRALPDTKVVKTLNTVNCALMVDAARVAGGDHDMFVCGNDPAAKARVTEILRGFFGWKNVVDLGPITSARATESYLHLWVRLSGILGTADFNVKLMR